MKTMKDNNSSIERSQNIPKDDALSLPKGWVKKWFAFSKMEFSAIEMIGNLKNGIKL